MVKIQFHPVWESKLTEKQKREMIEFAKSQTIPADNLEASLFRGKYKKNGGLVATVLLLNGRKQAFQSDSIKVKITDEVNQIIAEEVFELNLHLEPDTAQPWSFVFSRESVQIPGTNTAYWKIQLLINGQ